MPRLIMVLTITLAIATVSWRLIEQPVLRGRRRRAKLTAAMEPA